MKADEELIRTNVPARLDALPWGRFHVLVVAALGITWILDGIEVTLAGSVAGALEQSPTLRFTASEVGFGSSAYLAGAVLGALLFGWLTDRWGRRVLFFLTLVVYMVATAATAASWDIASYAAFRFFTGAGIGGEYAAINSTIQELLPARVRGWSDLAINGSFWIGAAMGAAGSIFFLNPGLFAADVGWRLCFLTGAVLSLPILPMRVWIPESPRWLMTHGRAGEAETVVGRIEHRLRVLGHRWTVPTGAGIALRMRASTPWREIRDTFFRYHPRRALVGVTLMAAQAFFYNAIFFTYALVLTNFYGVPSGDVGWYILPFAAGNVLGPLLLGRLFDTIGRKPMIAFTYAISGVLLAGSGYGFLANAFDATTMTIAWTVVFFFASAAASSAYLTVSETFPLEIRAIAIAVFYALGTALGGIAAPSLFGYLIETGSRESVFLGYLLGAVLMIVAAGVQAIWGVAAERRSLESVAKPLAAADD